MMEHHLNISFKASYSTLNQLSESTKNVWIVCHGYGQLANQFIRKFERLNKSEHFILAPQGLSKFYLADHRRVGATWMTKEDRETDLENQRSYFDSLFETVFVGHDLSNFKVQLFGFSQGVSMIARLAAYKKIQFNNLILWAGGFPLELSPLDFDYLAPKSKLKIVLGTDDQFYKLPEFQSEIDRAEKTVGLIPELIPYNGKHRVEPTLLDQLY